MPTTLGTIITLPSLTPPVLIFRDIVPSSPADDLQQLHELRIPVLTHHHPHRYNRQFADRVPYPYTQPPQPSIIIGISHQVLSDANNPPGAVDNPPRGSLVRQQRRPYIGQLRRHLLQKSIGNLLPKQTPRQSYIPPFNHQLRLTLHLHIVVQDELTVLTVVSSLITDSISPK